MTENTLAYTLPAAFALLPGSMNTPAAKAMLLAVGLQESDEFRTRRQYGGGPARGFWQFEKKGGVAEVLGAASTRKHIAHVCAELREAATVESCYVAIEHNDVLAAAFARLLLWKHPNLLPPQNQPDLAWRIYVESWRPGKPHRKTWNAYYAQAWALVMAQL